MDLAAQLDLGELRLRTLLPDDAELLVEATRQEQGRAPWGPRPAGPYSLDDARTALRQWDPADGKQVSYGVLRADRLVAAVGLMLDSPQSAELAYWVRPEQRRRGIGVRSVQAVTASPTPWRSRERGKRTGHPMGPHRLSPPEPVSPRADPVGRSFVPVTVPGRRPATPHDRNDERWRCRCWSGRGR